MSQTAESLVGGTLTLPSVAQSGSLSRVHPGMLPQHYGRYQSTLSQRINLAAVVLHQETR